jgi:hypothetical protein
MRSAFARCECSCRYASLDEKRAPHSMRLNIVHVPAMI